MEENPNIEEPKQTEEKDDAQMLMEELKKLDIQTPTDIQNMAFASQETGKAWNEVGNLRKEIDRLTREMESSKKTEYNPYEGETVELSKVVKQEAKEAMRELWTELQENQTKAQMMATRAMAEVKNDPEYQIVGDVFEKYINSPETLLKLQTGQTDYKTEYQTTKLAYYRNLAKRSSKTLEELMEGKKKAPPHMEQGTTETVPMTEQSDERRENLKRIKKEQREGASSEDTLRRIVENVMPDLKDDPSFFQP